MLYATGSAGLATLVRGSSRRIMTMRFRPANIRLINRRQNLPRLRLVLPSKNKNHPTDVQRLTGSLHIRAFSQLRWCREDRAMWFSLGENHAGLFRFALHLL